TCASWQGIDTTLLCTLSGDLGLYGDIRRLSPPKLAANQRQQPLARDGLSPLLCGMESAGSSTVHLDRDSAPVAHCRAPGSSRLAGTCLRTKAKGLGAGAPLAQGFYRGFH